MNGSPPSLDASAAPDLKGPAEAVEAHLRRFLQDRSLPPSLIEAMDYALMGGGKRLRPALAVRSAEAVGASAEDALPPGAAVELVHAFSLVHDDLPAMDDDDLRRGRPTLHKHTSEAMAILGGDAMLVLAFELLGEQVPDPALAGRLTRELSQAGAAMMAGQVYDTLPDSRDAPPSGEDSHRQQLERIHRHKTAALITASCRMGALAGGADQQQLQALSDYGHAIGLMFQAVDDLLDVTQTTAELGKTAQKDAEQGKLTYPAVLGVAGTRQEIERLRQAAHTALPPLGDSARPLRILADYLAVRQR
jgi:geranylgeranyl diphosphate synthase type II